MNDFRRTSPPRRRSFWWGLLLLVPLAGALLLYNFRGESAPPAPVKAPPQLRSVTLYFAAPDGAGLVAENRQLAECLLEEECLRTTIEALIGGPSGQLAPILPPRTRLRGVGVTGSEVQLDFSRDLIDGHPGGSLGELLTVYGLADTVAVNFPHLRQLRLLVEGSAVDTLKGHVDLHQPLLPDFSLLVSPPVARPAGAAPGASR